MTKKVELTLYYADWCRHCKIFKNNWGSIDNGIKNLNNNFPGVKITAVKFEEKELAKNGGGTINNNDIEGFPTLKIGLTAGKEHKEYEYSKGREPETILDYVHKIADGMSKYKPSK